MVTQRGAVSDHTGRSSAMRVSVYYADYRKRGCHYERPDCFDQAVTKVALHQGSSTASKIVASHLGEVARNWGGAQLLPCRGKKHSLPAGRSLSFH